MKKWLEIIVLIFSFVFLIILITPPVSATIPLTNTEPVITIDPVGNHTVGEVFYVNGTTNLGHWETTLDVDIEWWAFDPAGRWSPMYRTNATIQPGENGMGTWSAMILPSQWEEYTDVEHQRTAFRAADPGEYVAYVTSADPLGPSVTDQQSFFLFPQETVNTPEPGSQNIGTTTVPTQQNTPVLWYVPVIAVGAVSTAPTGT